MALTMQTGATFAAQDTPAGQQDTDLAVVEMHDGAESSTDRSEGIKKQCDSILIISRFGGIMSIVMIMGRNRLFHHVRQSTNALPQQIPSQYYSFNKEEI